MISAKPLKGGALSVVVAGDKPHLFYMHEDESMHYVVQDLETSTWKSKYHHRPRSTSRPSGTKRPVRSRLKEPIGFGVADMTIKKIA